jgi:hypothetical protein
LTDFNNFVPYQRNIIAAMSVENTNSPTEEKQAAGDGDIYVANENQQYVQNAPLDVNGYAAYSDQNEGTTPNQNQYSYEYNQQSAVPPPNDYYGAYGTGPNMTIGFSYPQSYPQTNNCGGLPAWVPGT